MNRKIKLSFEIDLEDLPKLVTFLEADGTPKESSEASEVMAVPQVPKETAVSQTDIRTAAAKLVKANRGKELSALFKTFGATKLSALPEEKYADFLAALEEL